MAPEVRVSRELGEHHLVGNLLAPQTVQEQLEAAPSGSRCSRRLHRPTVRTVWGPGRGKCRGARAAGPRAGWDLHLNDIPPYREVEGDVRARLPPHLTSVQAGMAPPSVS